MANPVNDVRKTLLVEHQAEAAMPMLDSLLAQEASLAFADRQALKEMLGLANLYLGRYQEASEIFMQTNNRYMAGYCQLLLANLGEATTIWRPLLSERPNHWCLILHGMATCTLNALPTFLQIRNNLETDIAFLIRANQQQMLTNLLNYVEILGDINYESFKFVGRAFFNAGLPERAGEYLIRGQKALPNDPEVYYHLGQYYHALGRFEEAGVVLHQCILISPTYTPALELHQELHAGQCSI